MTPRSRRRHASRRRRRISGMRNSAPLALLLLAVSAAPVFAGRPDGWHAKLEDAVAAAKKSGKPVFVVTLWGDGV